MSTVRVTFLMEGDDDEHEMGVSNEEFERINHYCSTLGGYDIEIERAEDEEEHVGGGPK